MLGREIVDAAGVDGDAAGLGLLPVTTRFESTKRVEAVDVTFCDLPPRWDVLSGVAFRGYEIRHGVTHAVGISIEVLAGGRGFACESVLGITVHGAFEEPAVVGALFGREPPRSLDTVFEELADLVEERLDMDALVRLAEV
jgi:adenosylcobyric acid synthase